MVALPFLVFAVVWSAHATIHQEDAGDAHEEQDHSGASRAAETCPTLAATVRSMILDGSDILTDEQWTARLGIPRGPPPLPMLSISPQASSSPFSSSCRPSEANQQLTHASLPEMRTRQREHRARTRSPLGVPERRQRLTQIRDASAQHQENLAASLRAQSEQMPAGLQQVAIDFALHFLRQLEAAGHSDQDISESASQLTSDPIRRWAAEDDQNQREEAEEELSDFEDDQVAD